MTPENQLLKLLETSTPFGSRAWNVATPKSDYDYIITFDMWLQIEKLLRDTDTNFAVTDRYNEFLGNTLVAKFWLNGKNYDLVVYNKISKYYKTVIAAVPVMTQFAEQVNINEKTYRTNTFEQLYNAILYSCKPTNKLLAAFVLTNFPELFI